MYSERILTLLLRIHPSEWVSHSVTEERFVSAELCGKTVTASHLCNREVKASARVSVKVKPECAINTIGWMEDFNL